MRQLSVIVPFSNVQARTFAAVGLLRVLYRRGVATSLTQIGDVRRLDFLRAFDQVVGETAAGRDAELLCRLHRRGAGAQVAAR